MMKRLVYLLIWMITMIITPVSAQDLIQNANVAYNNGEFKSAIEQYEMAADSLGTSSSLYYNIGNSYYKLGQLGKAVLYYERALKLNPNNDDAKFNLAFVNEKLAINNSNQSEANILTATINIFKGLASTNGWAVIAIVAFILIIILFLLYLFSTTILIRKVSFFGGIILFGIMVIANIFAFAINNNDIEGIITSQSVVLSTSPRIPKDKSEEAFLLNEGVKINIIDSLKISSNDSIQVLWYEVTVGDSDIKSWIRSTELELI